MKYKFYSPKSKDKETMGIVQASSLKEAYKIAALTKQLSPAQFKKLFIVEDEIVDCEELETIN
jgi:hypothetical protein